MVVAEAEMKHSLIIGQFDDYPDLVAEDSVTLKI